MKLFFYSLLASMSIVSVHTQSMAYAQEPHIIEIHAHRFSFEPSEITLKRDEPVTLRLISDDVSHSLMIPDLGVNQEIKKGKPADVNVDPKSVGDFHGQCGHFCGGGHGSMTFVVHVKD